MGFEQIDEAIKAGESAENADFATPTGTAGINPLKTEKRKIYIAFHFENAQISGAVVDALSGAFPGFEMPDGSATYILLGAMMPRGEVSPGESAILHIIWKTAGNTGNVRFVVDVKPIITGTSSLASAVQRAIIQAANATGGSLSDAKIIFPPALFTNDQCVSIKIARDGTNSLDTIGAAIQVHGAYLEILGRC